MRRWTRPAQATARSAPSLGREPPGATIGTCAARLTFCSAGARRIWADSSRQELAKLGGGNRRGRPPHPARKPVEELAKTTIVEACSFRDDLRRGLGLSRGEQTGELGREAVGQRSGRPSVRHRSSTLYNRADAAGGRR